VRTYRYGTPMPLTGAKPVYSEPVIAEAFSLSRTKVRKIIADYFDSLG
jgi:hypothetical protein